MAKHARPQKTKYPGVTFIEVINAAGKVEKSFYVTYRDPTTHRLKNISCGRSGRDDMTPARAAIIRAELIEGKRKTRKTLEEEAAANPTIEQLWSRYREELKNPRTLATDKSNYKHLAASFGHHSPKDLCTADLDALKTVLRKAGKSEQTIKHTLGLLRRIIRFGAKKGLCPLPDLSRLYFDLPSIDNVKTENLTEQQIRQLLAALDADEDQIRAKLAKLALFTGMRRGALTGLEWRDLDFERNFLVLRGENAKKGKTETIPMNAQARSLLLSIAPHPESPYVFPGKNGRRLDSFKAFFSRIRKAANLPQGFRPLHGLRHTYASWLASSGEVDLYTLQKLLTHSSPEMAQRYAHLADSAMRRAAGVAAEIFPRTQERALADIAEMQRTRPAPQQDMVRLKPPADE